jgi:orotate phosphoribosyltransferase
MSTVSANSNQLAQDIAASLLNIGAVSLRPDQPFTWTSGMKSPIYCDNRVTISFPEIRNQIAEGFAAVIRANYPDAEVIAGAATGGIPHAAWVADKLGLPMVYVRDKAKGHGKENKIEGVLKPGQKTIVIEDLISTGGSSLKVAESVREVGAEAQAVIAIFTYEFPKAAQAFADASVPLHTLSNFSALIDVAVQQGVVKPEHVELLQAWKNDPAEYAKSFE